MKRDIFEILEHTISTHPRLKCCQDQIWQAFVLLEQCFVQGGKVLICGNGGSAADTEHIVGELMKGFLRQREIPQATIEQLKTTCPDDWAYLAAHLQQALPAISLVSQVSLATAFVNDQTADMLYAQEVYAYAKPGDILIAISTSGNSRNVVNALKVAKAVGIGTIGLTGATGGAMINYCDIRIAVPETITYMVQELHLPVYHALCAMLEAAFFTK